MAPVAFVIQRNAQANRRSHTDIAQDWYMHVRIEVWVPSGVDPNFIPAITLNNIVNYITNLLPPSLNNQGVIPNNLNIPTVKRLFIEGDVTYDNGIIAPNSFADIPVTIVCM